jgi:hypothetical protein
MELLTLLTLIAVGLTILKSREQHRRIALLGTYLGKHQIEKLMESLTDGYLRALREEDPERKAQIWSMLDSAEVTLCTQFNRFVAEFAEVDEVQARVSKLPIGLPLVDTLFPQATFDLRKLLSVHAHGIGNAAQNTLNQTQKNKAYTLSAELFLMQHTCHWFCRSKAVASARMMARHKTPYAQLLDSVAPATREAYSAVTGG